MSTLSEYPPCLRLKLGELRPADLYQAEHLPRLDAHFLHWLDARDEALGQRMRAFRDGQVLAPAQCSDLLIGVAKHLEDFLVHGFGVEEARAQLRRQSVEEAPVHAFKEHCVRPIARQRRQAPAEDFETLDARLSPHLPATGDIELALARLWQTANQTQDDAILALISEWTYSACHTQTGQRKVQDWVSFRLPQKLDPFKLVPMRRLSGDPMERLEGTVHRQRDGFHLTDTRCNGREAMDQAHYCVYCHDHAGDRCSKGFGDKAGAFRRNLLGVELTGCPLEEKISEANLLKRDGYTLGALAMIMIDNPLLPATGHRICNDCMTSCIYQKQTPVNVPQLETRILTEVLDWPWGFEIYHLLTRWNPLNRERPYTLPYNGIDILCVGAGPAGFNLSHHLLQAGFGVVAVDGLKIEPLPPQWIGQSGQPPVPIHDTHSLYESLDERRTAGFGGVAEYGITVRWDKNFLKLIQITLCRHAFFRIYGGVRFGGTLTVEDAWEMGFQHVALCTGAGKPSIPAMDNHLAHGVRQASDFLMALQLTGAAKRDSLASLQVRLPAVVIGGGLTAIDTATEVQAYYIRQVEKMLERYETLLTAGRGDAVAADLGTADKHILEEFLTHGRQVRAERVRAHAAGEAPDFISLLHAWGGVTVAYRRAIQDSPAYRRNHEEIDKALQEGIFYAEALSPQGAELDELGHVRALRFNQQRQNAVGVWEDGDTEVVLPARAVFVAAGSSPNTSYEREHPGTFKMQGRFYAAFTRDTDGNLHPAPDGGHCKAPAHAFFTSHAGSGRVSFHGDAHPAFHGSVVKAMASGRHGARAIIQAFGPRMHPASATEVAAWQAFSAALDARLRARVDQVERLGPRLLRLSIRAPQASRNWQPGQVYRLQNYEHAAERCGDTLLQMEGVALDGVQVDRDRGVVSLLVNEVGVSTRIAGRLRAGDPVLLMGPSGTGMPRPEGRHIVVIGHRAALTSLMDGSELWRSLGKHVTFVAHFPDGEAVAPVRALARRLADELIWVLDRGPGLLCQDPQESCMDTGMAGFLDAAVDGGAPWLQRSDMLLVSDTPLAMERLAAALKGPLRPLLKPTLQAIAAVTSPMQCMLKEVCAQCLCGHRDPETGLPGPTVFSCFNHHQPLLQVDFANLKVRQDQNVLQEHLGRHWLDYLLSGNDQPFKIKIS